LSWGKGALSELGKYDLEGLRDSAVLQSVKRVFSARSKALGGYSKRVIGSGKAYVTHQEFCDRVTEAGPEKLAKTLRISAF